MQYLFTIILLSSIAFTKPDPKAKALMDKVHAVYENASSLDIQFSYEQSNSDIVGLAKKGQLLSKGAMYKLILDELEIYSDGKTQYTYLKKNKEVQITEPDDKENKYHPKHIADIYKSGTHEYAITKTIKEGSINKIIVDFQTIDKMDPISKIKLYIDEKTNQIAKVQWIDKDGSKTIVSFSKSKFNTVIPDSSFVLNTQLIKGVHLEDLRD